MSLNISEFEPMIHIKALKKLDGILNSNVGIFNRNGEGKEVVVADAGAKNCTVLITKSNDFCVCPVSTKPQLDSEGNYQFSKLPSKGWPYLYHEPRAMEALYLISKRDKVFEFRDIQKLAWSAWIYNKKFQMNWLDAARVRSMLDSVGFNLVNIQGNLFKVKFFRRRRSGLEAKFTLMKPIECVSYFTRDVRLKVSSQGFLFK